MFFLHYYVLLWWIHNTIIMIHFCHHESGTSVRRPVQFFLQGVQVPWQFPSFSAHCGPQSNQHLPSMVLLRQLEAVDTFEPPQRVDVNISKKILEFVRLIIWTLIFDFFRTVRFVYFVFILPPKYPIQIYFYIFWKLWPTASCILPNSIFSKLYFS